MYLIYLSASILQPKCLYPSDEYSDYLRGTSANNSSFRIVTTTTWNGRSSADPPYSYEFSSSLRTAECSGSTVWIVRTSELPSQCFIENLNANSNANARAMTSRLSNALSVGLRTQTQHEHTQPEAVSID